MFVQFQIPLADVRRFLPFDTRMLHRPVWPLVEPPKREFARYSGSAKNRDHGGIEEWPGEETFCGSWRALRFKMLEKQKYRDATPSSSFRRFFHDGNVVARVEAGIRYERLFFYREMMRPKEIHLPPGEWLDVARHAAALPVAVTMGNRPVGESALCAAGQFLPFLYLYATTAKEQSASSQLASWWIDAGTPMILVSDEYWPDPPPFVGEAEGVRTFADFEQEGIHLGFTTLTFGDLAIPTWLMLRKRRDPANRSRSLTRSEVIARRLRVSLFRWHAAWACLRLVLKRMIEEKIPLDHRTDATAALGRYINHAAEYVEKPKEKVDISSLSAAALNTIALVSPGELATLRTTLEQVGEHLNESRQRFLTTEAQKAMGTHIGSIGGDYVMGDKVGGDKVGGDQVGGNKVGGDYAGHDLNKAGGDQIQAGRDANVQKDIDSSVERLSGLIAQLKVHLPAEKQPEIQQHLETVKQQATAAKPDRGQFEVSAKGLVEAAKAVGQMAVPIVKTVGFIAKALFGVSIAL